MLRADLRARRRRDHPSLLEKLSKYGIAGNLFKWLGGLLSKRRQRVVLGQDHSDWISVMIGVPQASVLGSTLFAVFINDLPGDLMSTCRIFEDDTKIIAPILLFFIFILKHILIENNQKTFQPLCSTLMFEIYDFLFSISLILNEHVGPF